jgi:hypothetical protein
VLEVAAGGEGLELIEYEGRQGGAGLLLETLDKGWEMGANDSDGVALLRGSGNIATRSRPAVHDDPAGRC